MSNSLDVDWEEYSKFKEEQLDKYKKLKEREHICPNVIYVKQYASKDGYMKYDVSKTPLEGYHEYILNENIIIIN